MAAVSASGALLVWVTTSVGQSELLPYWPQTERAAYAEYEAALNAVPSRESLLAYHQLLADEPHIAGTEGDARTIERLAKAFGDMGLEVEVHEFWAYLCLPVDSALEVVSPEPVKLSTRESALQEDTYSGNAALTPGWNAYSASGDVTAPVVYANYGTKEDFAKLRELGVDCTGKIVLARYGGNFRGFKAKFAEQAGAVGLVIFTDPADSGYTKGLMYPEGTWANDTCIQRGSILTLDYPGDPLTPGIEATEGAARLDPADVALPKIPVQPVGWQAAQEIMARMTGPGVPAGWQGGMPLPYRVTGGEGLTVRLMVKQERKVVRSANVLARLRGAEHPEQMVVVGAHHDAWGYGAADPLCGTICVLESARSFAELAKAGRRPARSIVFAAWGAEEFGIIGSTEWVEAHADELTSNAVGYINLDMAVMGPEFGSGATPDLRRLIVEASHAVPQARDASRTVFEAWTMRPAGPVEPAFGDMGGGSDHVGFVCHTGVPSCSLGGGGAPGTSYHSLYDTLPWYWKTVGEDYEPTIMVTRMTNAVAGRLADGPLLAIDPVGVMTDARRHLVDLTGRGVTLGVFAKPDGQIAAQLAPVEEARARAEAAARATMAKVLARVESGELAGEDLERVNRSLIDLRRALLSDSAQPDRPWFRNLYAATDEDSGYAAWMLPGLRWAVERQGAKNGQRVADMVRMYVEAFDSIARAMEEIGGAPGGVPLRP
jgi:N-acetylated-alpha-linked acidic dipeptidase